MPAACSSHPPPLPHTQACAYTGTNTHTDTHPTPPPHACASKRTYTHTHSHYLFLSLTNTCIRSLSHFVPLSCFLCLSLSHWDKHTHTNQNKHLHITLFCVLTHTHMFAVQIETYFHTPSDDVEVVQQLLHKSSLSCYYRQERCSTVIH